MESEGENGIVTPSSSVTSTEADMDEGSSGERRSSNRIPYLPEEVVKHLLRYLPVPDLMSCRLVNKTWNPLAVEVLNQRPSNVILIPYLPEEVVKCLLRYLPVSDLMSCRLVNKTWNRPAVEVLNQRMDFEIHIKSRECVTKHCKTFGNSIEGVSLKVRSLLFHKELFEEIVDGTNDGVGASMLLTLDLQRLAEIFEEQVTKLTVTLDIGISKFLETSGTRNEVYDIICQIVFVHYPLVEELELSLKFPFDGMPGEHRDLEEEENMMQGHSLPKLKSFTISKTRALYLERPELRAFENLPKSVMNFARNLKTLVCEPGYAHKAANDLLQIPQHIQTLHLRGGEETSDSCELTDEHMMALIQHGFPQLKSLHLENISISWYTNDNDEIVKSFLKKFADTLTILWVDGLLSSDYPTFPPCGLTLRQLKRLSLVSFKGKIVWENLPALNELVFHDTEVTSDKLHSSTLPTDWPIAKFTFKISQLRQPNLKKIYPSLACPLFPIWFSKLSSLTLIFSEQTEIIEALPGIFHCCRQLKSLAVSNNHEQLFRQNESIDLDGCITGISKSELVILKEKCPAFGENVEVDPVSKENVMKMIEVSKSTRSSAPNIGNLSELQELSLRGSFSIAAVLFGVVYCTKLRSLELMSPRLTWNVDRIVSYGLPELTKLFLHMM